MVYKKLFLIFYLIFFFLESIYNSLQIVFRKLLGEGTSARIVNNRVETSWYFLVKTSLNRSRIPAIACACTSLFLLVL
jgi:hypothetical protein